MNFVPAELKAGKLRTPFGETRLHECFSQMADKSVIAGFRSEAVSCVSSADITTPGLVFQVTVDRVEWLGAELFVYAESISLWRQPCTPERMNYSVIAA